MGDRMPIPSMSGRRVLMNLHHGKDIGHGLAGAATGTLCGTIAALQARGLLDKEQCLTESGHRMIQQLTETPEVHRAA